jgi:hypothetical protein
VRQVVDRWLDGRRFTVQSAFKFKQQTSRAYRWVHSSTWQILCRLITEIRVDEIAYRLSRLSPIPALLSVLVVSCKLHVQLICLVPRGRSSPADVWTAERHSLLEGKEVRVIVVVDVGWQVTLTSITGTKFYKMWLKFQYVIIGGIFNFAK